MTCLRNHIFILISLNVNLWHCRLFQEYLFSYRTEFTNLIYKAENIFTNEIQFILDLCFSIQIKNRFFFYMKK